MCRILFIITKGNNIGGAQTYVLELAKKFRDKGYFVEFIVGTKGFLTDKLDTENISFVHIPELSNSFNPFINLKSLIKIIFYLKKNNPNIVSLNSSKAGFLGRIACFWAKVPAVFTVHGWSFTDGIESKRKIIYSTLERLVKKYCQAWIVVSKFDYEMGINSKVSRRKDTHIIHNGVEIKQPNNHRVELKSRPISIVVTARHDKQKDYLTIFKALQLVNNVKVYLLGDGPLIERNKKVARELNVIDKLIFVGFTSEVQRYLRNADIFLLITNWEGFPFSILEAMNNQLPVIATDICGISEAVVNGNTGFLVKPNSPQILAEKLNLLVNNGAMRSKMGNNGYTFLKDNFSLDSMFQKTEDVFKIYMRK